MTTRCCLKQQINDDNKKVENDSFQMQLDVQFKHAHNVFELLAGTRNKSRERQNVKWKSHLYVCVREGEIVL